MSTPEKIRASARGLGGQLYLLAHKLSSESTVGAFKDLLAEAVQGLQALVTENPKIREALFLEELLFNLWIADICLEDKTVSGAMFSELVKEVFSKSKAGTSIERLSVSLRDVYQQRNQIYIRALEKDQAAKENDVISAMSTARIDVLNSALPNSMKIPANSIYLHTQLQIEWLTNLKCFQTAIDKFNVSKPSDA